MLQQIQIDDVVDYLGLVKESRRNGASSYNVRCPFCNDKKYHMNINRSKNTYNCVRCTGKSGGGMLDLFARAALGTELIPGKKANGGNGDVLYAKMCEAIEGGVKTDYKPKAEYKEPERILRASDKKVSSVYSMLIRFKPFVLAKAHYDNLIKRGLDDASIKRNGYCSITNDFSWTDLDFYKGYKNDFEKNNLEKECRKYSVIKGFKKEELLAGYIVASEILREGAVSDFEGIPGFFKINNAWFFKIEVGMLIPTRNPKGEIVALQARKDKGNLRYMTISSKDLPLGVTEGISRVHFPRANTKNLTASTEVLIIEGPLKADVCAQLYNNKDVLFVAIQGVNNRAELPDLFKRFSKKGVKTIYNALDMDKTTNIHVASAGRAIAKQAKIAGLTMKNKLWDEDYAKVKYEELASICKEHGVEIAKEDNIFIAIGRMATTLEKKGISHSLITDEKGNSIKNYWSDETKGLDDYLLKLKSKSLL